MRLSDVIKYRSIVSGGPPSGKGPGSGHYDHVHKTLTQTGWKKDASDYKGRATYSWKKDDYLGSHGKVYVSPNGDWEHSNPWVAKESIAKGNADEVDDHFKLSAPKLLAKHEAMSKDELKAIRSYGSIEGEFGPNTYLLTGKGGTPAILKSIQHMDSAIAKGTVIKNMTVFRGVAGDYANSLLKVKVGSTFPGVTYQSTSLNPDVAEDFASEHSEGELGTGAVLKIYVPKGTKGFDMNQIPRGQAGQIEDELLLSRITKYKVRSVNAKKRLIDVEVVI